MTRGDEDIERGASEKVGGGLLKFVYFKTNRRGGFLKN